MLIFCQFHLFQNLNKFQFFRYFQVAKCKQPLKTDYWEWAQKILLKSQLAFWRWVGEAWPSLGRELRRQGFSVMSVARPTKTNISKVVKFLTWIWFQRLILGKFNQILEYDKYDFQMCLSTIWRRWVCCYQN